MGRHARAQMEIHTNSLIFQYLLRRLIGNGVICRKKIRKIWRKTEKNMEKTEYIIIWGKTEKYTYVEQNFLSFTNSQIFH